MDTKKAAYKLALDIVERRRRELLQREERKYEPSGNYASSLYDCPRRGYYDRVLWERRQGIPAEVQGRLEVGSEIHRWAANWFAGKFNVAHVELPLNYKPWDLRGRVDLVIETWVREEGKEEDTRIKVPVEVKSITDQAWSKVRDLDSLMEQEWTRKYVRQLWAYELTFNVDVGILFFVGIPSGNVNPVVVPLDYERAEKEVAQYCTTVAEAVEGFWAEAKGFKGTDEDVLDLAERHAPDRIQYDEQVCGRCPWFGVCTPARKASDSETLQVLTDENLISDIYRLKELEPLAKEHEQVKKRVKARLHGVKTAIAGTWSIAGKEITTRRLTIPKTEQERIKVQHPEWVKTSSYWKHTIEKLTTKQERTWEMAAVADRLRRIVGAQEDF